MGVYDRPLRKPEMYGTFGEHKELCRKIAQESIVLLKNSGSILPVPEGKSILIMGKQELQSGKGSGNVAGYMYQHSDHLLELDKR